MIEKDLDKVLNYMKQYVENKYEHDSEPMLTWKDLKLVLNEIDRLNKDLETSIEICNNRQKEIVRLNNIINELEKWLEESIEKHTDDYIDWKYDRNVYLAGSEKLQNVFDKLQELKGADKE